MTMRIMTMVDMTTFFTPALLLALAVAVATGLMGAFAQMKKMTLAGDTMSHIALPGIGLAILWGVDPTIGAAASLAIGALFIWKIEKATGLSTETMIGVVFASALALGTLVTPSDSIIEALFGGEGTVTLTTLLIYVALSALVVLYAWIERNRLILTLFNVDLAEVTGVKVSWVNLRFLLAFALTLVLGLRFLGAILVGALVIIPAAIGRQLTETLPSFLLVSAGSSVLAVLIGYALASVYGFQTGPTVVLSASAMFLLSLLKKKV